MPGLSADGDEQGFASCDQRRVSLFVFGKQFRLRKYLLASGAHRGAFRHKEPAGGGLRQFIENAKP